MKIFKILSMALFLICSASFAESPSDDWDGERPGDGWDDPRGGGDRYEGESCYDSYECRAPMVCVGGAHNFDDMGSCRMPCNTGFGCGPNQYCHYDRWSGYEYCRSHH